MFTFYYCFCLTERAGSVEPVCESFSKACDHDWGIKQNQCANEFSAI